ncbi:hypothetical protein GCM10009664_67230 [Kitasatospora gansuensis]
MARPVSAVVPSSSRMRSGLLGWSGSGFHRPVLKTANPAARWARAPTGWPAGMGAPD